MVVEVIVNVGCCLNLSILLLPLSFISVQELFSSISQPEVFQKHWISRASPPPSNLSLGGSRGNFSQILYDGICPHWSPASLKGASEQLLLRIRSFCLRFFTVRSVASKFVFWWTIRDTFQNFTYGVVPS